MGKAYGKILCLVIVYTGNEIEARFVENHYYLLVLLNLSICMHRSIHLFLIITFNHVISCHVQLTTSTLGRVFGLRFWFRFRRPANLARSATNFIHRSADNTLAVDEIRDAIPRQPRVLRHDKVRKKSKDGHASHDDRSVVEGLACYRECIRREEHRNNPSVPKDTNHLEWFGPLSKTPRGLGESFRGEEETREADEAVCCGRGDTGC